MDIAEVDYYLSLLLWDALFIGLGLIAAWFTRSSFQWRWFAFAFLLFNIVIALVLDFAGLNGLIYDGLGNPELQFNWAGKIVALAFSLAMLSLPFINARAAGVTFIQSGAWRTGWSVFAIFCVIDIVIAVLIETPAFDSEAIAYQLTMPSIEEEIFFRGLLLFCLIKAFGDGPRIVRADFGWAALISALLFGVIHSAFWTVEGPVFIWELFVFAGGIGVLLTWLRLSTGSILAPLLLHSVINTVWRVI